MPLVILAHATTYSGASGDTPKGRWPAAGGCGGGPAAGGAAGGCGGGPAAGGAAAAGGCGGGPAAGGGGGGRGGGLRRRPGGGGRGGGGLRRRPGGGGRGDGGLRRRPGGGGRGGGHGFGRSGDGQGGGQGFVQCGRRAPDDAGAVAAQVRGRPVRVDPVQGPITGQPWLLARQPAAPVGADLLLGARPVPDPELGEPAAPLVRAVDVRADVGVPALGQRPRLPPARCQRAPLR